MPISFGVAKAGVGKAGGGASRGARGRGRAASFVQATMELDTADAEERTVNSAAAARLCEEGVAAAEVGNFALALSKWDGAVALDPTSATTHELRGQAHLATESWWDAIQAAERAVAIDAGLFGGWLTLGRAQLNFGEFAKAVGTFERVLAIDAAAAREEGAEEDLGRARQLAGAQQQREFQRVEVKHTHSVANASGSGGVAIMGGGMADDEATDDPFEDA